MSALAMVVAVILDGALGWPDRLFRRLGHPVTWIGRVISAADVRLNRDQAPDAKRRRNGVITVLGVVLLVGGVTIAISALLPGGWAGVVLTGVLAWPLVAARSLYEHVARVAAPLVAGDLEGARTAVSMIVGRNPETLDAPAIARAGIESLAENASDGVIAPLFWGVIFGLPGIAVYKAINTMDSMIGYKTPRHAQFGWAAARLDDLVNWIPARLTGLLIVAVSRQRTVAFRTMVRDARGHRSPNAGWPEAAMAGALGVRLSGPRHYADGPSDDPFLNPGAADPKPQDMIRALRAFDWVVVLTAGLLVLVATV